LESILLPLSCGVVLAGGSPCAATAIALFGLVLTILLLLLLARSAIAVGDLLAETERVDPYFAQVQEARRQPGRGWARYLREPAPGSWMRTTWLDVGVGGVWLVAWLVLFVATIVP